MEIPYAGQVGREEYIRVLSGRLLSRRTKWAVAAAVGFVILLLVGSFVALAKDPEATYVITMPIALLVVLALIPRFMLGAGSRAWDRYASEALRQPQRGRFTEEGIHLATAVSQGYSAWGAFVKYQRVDDIVVLYQSPRLMSIYPRAFFQSEEDWEAFTALVASRLPEASQVRDKPALAFDPIVLVLLPVLFLGLLSLRSILAILWCGA